MAQKLVFDKILLPSNNVYYIKDTDGRTMITSRNYTSGVAYTTGNLLIYQNELYRVTQDTTVAQNTNWEAMTDAQNPRVTNTTIDFELGQARMTISGIMTYIGVATSNTEDSGNPGSYLPIIDGSTYSSIRINNVVWTSDNAYDSTNHKFTTGSVVISGIGSSQKEYVWNGSNWNEFGSTGSLKGLAFKDSASGNYDKATSASVTFTPSVSPTTSNLKATASDGAVSITSTAAAITGFGNHSTETFVKSYPGTNSNLVTTTVKPAGTDVSVPNVTSVGSASTWSFTIDSTDSEKLIISGANGTAPSLGTALNCAGGGVNSVTVATGSLAANGTGDSVMTGLGAATTDTAIKTLGTATTANCATAISLSKQPTITLTTPASADTTTASVVTAVTPSEQTATASITYTSTAITVS